MYSHPSRSPFRAPRGLDVGGLGAAAHAAAAPPGSVGRALGTVAGVNVVSRVDSSYAYKNQTLQLGETYDGMSLGIDDSSFLVGTNAASAINRNMAAAHLHTHQNNRTSSMKSSSKKKKRAKDKLTTLGGVAPKRGEYKCGKCGFFPKKSKHDCDERVKRGSTGKSKVALSVEEMAAKEYQYGAPIKIMFGDASGPY